MNPDHAFSRFSRAVSKAAGSPLTFVAAMALVVVWAATGPMFHYSETWQLVINTGTTIITFLMVFLIQNSQNRDSQAMQLKLDEIILAMSQADNEMIDIENLGAQALEVLRRRYARIVASAEKRLADHQDARGDAT
jgi:low affinity Fe/Cu permease